MTGLRLALVAPRFWPLVGGGEAAMAGLAAEFLRQGARPRVVTARWDADWPREFAHGDTPVLRLARPAAPVVGTFWRLCALARWLRQERPRLDGVLVSTLRHEAWCAVRALRGSGVPVVLRAEAAGAGGDCRWQRTAACGGRVRDLCREAAAIVAPTESVAEELRGCGYRSDRVARIDNGVPLPPRRSAATQAAARRALREVNHDLALDEGAPLVVCLSRFAPEKGLIDLVRAWRPVAERWPMARLFLAGDGPQRDELFELVSDLDLRYRVCLPGSFDDPSELLAAADAFVLSAREEGTTIPLLEAMAAELPCLATDLPAHRATLGDGADECLAPPGDVAALAQALVRVLSQPAAIAQRGAANRRRVEERFSLPRTAGAHLQLFARLRGAAAGPLGRDRG